MKPERIAEITHELDAIESIRTSVESTFETMPTDDQQSVYHESLALKLHNFYTGYERLFALIAVDVNGGVPRSPDWHRRLLKSMSLEIPGIRPAVISKHTEPNLQEYLSFRHLVRNIYGFELNFDRMKRLIEELPEVVKVIDQEINTFLGFLRSLTRLD